MKGKTKAEVLEELKKTGASEEKMSIISPHKVSEHLFYKMANESLFVIEFSNWDKIEMISDELLLKMNELKMKSR